MKFHSFAGPLAAAALFSCASVAEAGILVPVPPVQGATFTGVHDINAGNLIAGVYGSQDGNWHGFVGTLDGHYTSFDYPGAASTSVVSINDDGYITGYALNAQFNYTAEFVRNPATGKFATVLDSKGGKPLVGETGGILSKTRFVGDWTDDNNATFHGYYGKGKYMVAELTLPFNTNAVRPFDQNEHGSVVGYFFDNDSVAQRGFLLKDDAATAIDYPDANVVVTFLNGISSKNLISGYAIMTDGTRHAFVLDPGTMKFQDISVSGSTKPTAFGINNAGVVTVNANGAPYLYCMKKKTCPLQSPNAREIPERWISAAKFSRRLSCKNGCVGSYYRNSSARDPVALRAAITRGL